MAPRCDGVAGFVGERFVAESLGRPDAWGMGRLPSARPDVYPASPDEEPRPPRHPDRKPAGYADDGWIGIDWRGDAEWERLATVISAPACPPTWARPQRAAETGKVASMK
jgi:hypothetical protein